jgi:hypothetical protein
MKIINFLVLAALAGFFSSCADTGGSKAPNQILSVDSKGNCTEDSTEYDDLLERIKNHESDSDIYGQTLKVKKTCDDFFKYHDNAICIANLKDEETQISTESIVKSSDIKKNCDYNQTVTDSKLKTDPSISHNFIKK